MSSVEFSTPRTPFLRVKTTPSAKRSLFLSDLEGFQNRSVTGNKVACYVPVGGQPVDLPYLDRVVTSHLRGSLAGFIKLGLLTAEVLEGDTTARNPEEAQSGTGIYQADSSGGDVTVLLPWPAPVGTLFKAQKVSPDANTVTLTSNPAGGALQGGPLVLSAEGEAATLYLDEDGVWWNIQASGGAPAPVPDLDFELAGPFTSGPVFAGYRQTVVADPLDNTGLQVLLPDPSLRPGGMVEVCKINPSAFPVLVISDGGALIDGSFLLMVAPRETASFRSLGALGWTRIS